MLARASADVRLRPGDLIGSGTVGTGCILELGPENTGGWLKPGDVVELEIEKLGVLRTPIVARPPVAHAAHTNARKESSNESVLPCQST
jgi:fumarylacetoacetate (FAA) hydrolase